MGETIGEGVHSGFSLGDGESADKDAAMARSMASSNLSHNASRLLSATQLMEMTFASVSSERRTEFTNAVFPDPGDPET